MRIFRIIVYTMLLVILAGALSAVGFFYYAVTQPVSSQQGTVDFVIEPGEKTRDVAERLTTQGLIRQPLIFYLYVRAKQSVIQNGKYELSPSFNIVKIADIMANSKRNEKKVTIIEGWSHWQIAEALNKAGLGDFNTLDEALAKEEGYLFPDTYRFAENSTVAEIIDVFKKNFTNRTKELAVNKNSIIIASLLEREGKTEAEKKVIASIISNRLDKGTTLDIDATIQYAKGSWKMINRNDIETINSPYNTYKNIGLPPGPICNPSLISIKAALNPDKTDYLYYFHSREGKAVYSKSLSEHNANIQKFGVSGS